jgi:hypothetical protein
LSGDWIKVGKGSFLNALMKNQSEAKPTFPELLD